MADNLGDVIDQDRLSPLAALAAAGQGLWNWGGLAGLPSLRELITGATNQPPLTINAQNAPQLPPDSPDPIRPSPVTTQMTPYIRGAPGTQSGFAIPDPNALPNVRPNSPLASNTTGIRGYPGTQSGPGWGRPDRPYGPYQAEPSATKPDFPAGPDPHPPPMPKPVADTRPDLPGQPGAKEPDPTQWGVSHSPLQDLITRVTKHLDEQQPIPPPVLAELPRPVSQQVQNSWMSTVLSSAGLLLAAFGSRRSAAPMTAAIKSFGGYLQGYQQGQEEVWKQKQEEYKEQLDYALQRNQLELDRYKIAVEASKGDTEKLHEMLYAASILNEDERGKAELEQGRTKEFFQYIEAKQKWWEDVQAVRHNNFLSGLHEPEPPEPPMPPELRSYFDGGGGGAGGGGALDIVKGQESSGRWNVTGPTTDSGPARGGYQITDGTWKQYAPPDVQRKWPTADQAPPEVQTEVAKTIPISRWADKTRNALHRRFGDFDESQTLGQLEKQHPSGGTQVAGPGGGTTPQPTTTTPQPATPGQVVASGSPADQLARKMLRGGEPPAGTDKDELKYASAQAQRLAQQVDAVLANPDLKGQAVIDAVRKIDGPLADSLQRIANNQEPVPAGSGFGTRLYDLRETMSGLARKVDPKWVPGQYEAKQKIRDQFTGSGLYGKTLFNTGVLTNAAVNVLRAANAMQGQSVPAALLDQWWAGSVSNDPRYKVLSTAIRNFAQVASTVTSGGSMRVGPFQELLKQIPTTATPEAIREIVSVDLSDAQARIGEADRIWKAQFPDEGEPLGLDPNAELALAQILNMNTETGDFGVKADELSPLLRRAVPGTSAGGRGSDPPGTWRDPTTNILYGVSPP